MAKKVQLQDIDENSLIISQATELTYSELVELRNNSQLVAGAIYIITDYEFTTSVANTTSGGHNFDIIVVADNENTLSEFARARRHEGDTYYINSDLNAWELKYSLDNDISKFEWADEVNGKGVIYYMKDEWENEVPYDFKNMTFQVKEGLVYNQWGTDYNLSRNTSLDTTISGEQYYGYTADKIINGVSATDILVKDNPVTTSSALYKTDGSVINMGGTIKEVVSTSYDYYTFNKAKGVEGNFELTAVNFVIQDYGNTYFGSKGNKVTSFKEDGLQKLNINTFDRYCHFNELINCAGNIFMSSCWGNKLINSNQNIFISNNSFNELEFSSYNSISASSTKLYSSNSNTIIGSNNTLINCHANNIHLINSILNSGCSYNKIGTYSNIYSGGTSVLNLLFKNFTLGSNIENLSIQGITFTDPEYLPSDYQIEFKKVPNGDIVATWMDATHKLHYKYTTDNGATWLDGDGNELNVGKMYECFFNLSYMNDENELYVGFTYLSRNNNLITKEEFFNLLRFKNHIVSVTDANEGLDFIAVMDAEGMLNNQPCVAIFTDNYEFYKAIPLYDENLNLTDFKYREL